MNEASMVNHVRTLLLNLRPVAPIYPAGEEYVPPDFQPSVLPQTLNAARNALFGSAATRAAINLNLARLLAYAHTSPLGPDLFLTDARITYDPTSPAPDSDPTATPYNFTTAANGFPGDSTLFRFGASDAETRWAEFWDDASAPAPLRATALALALAARIAAL